MNPAMIFSAVSCQPNKKPDQSHGGGGSQLPDKPNDGFDELKILPN